MDSGNEYVIQVKKNQKALFVGIQKIVLNSKPVDSFEKKETNKGRKEQRKVGVFLNVDGHLPTGWKNINRIIEVTNEGEREGRQYFEKHYYISSLSQDKAVLFALGIRAHWSIENNLHRVKDVIQNEDGSLIVDKRISANLSLIKSVTISVFRSIGCSSIKYALERYRNKVEDCLELIGKYPILKK